MLALINKLRRILPRAYKLFLVGLGGLMVFGAMLELAALGVIMILVSAFTASREEGIVSSSRWVQYTYRLSHADSPRTFVVYLAVFLILFYIFKALFNWFSLWCQSWFITKLSIHISKRMFCNYLAAPYGWHIRMGSAQLIYRVEQVESFAQGVLKPALLVATELVVCLVLIAVLFTAMPKISCLAAGLGAFLLLAIYLPLRKILTRFGEICNRAGEKALLFLNQGLSAVREVKLTGTESFFDHQLDLVQTKRLFARKKILDFSDIPRFAMEAFCIIIAMCALLIMIRSGEDFAGILFTAALFITAMFRLLPCVSRIQYSLFSIRSNLYLFDHIYEDLTAIPREELPDSESAPLSFTREIRVDHVTFTYSPELPPVIRDLSLNIACCESVALVGRTGCGKTTLADLILGFYRPNSGRILIDGVLLSEKNLRSWRTRVGYVPQNVVLFDDTVRANIAFGMDPDKVDMERYHAAVRMAQADTFIDELPEKDLTVVGEEGVRLSGGQRQRIAIARALYNQPELLVFDEATSALDNETEKALIDALKALKGKITILMIAHRLSSIEHCDRIVSLDKEEGKEPDRS
ncbi:MAG: ABC transporter ATP-binding protein [Lentisphaeria bacterium]|nr:ABC transporter ATP-binding protein [Lentisphaeria bacterium]